MSLSSAKSKPPHKSKLKLKSSNTELNKWDWNKELGEKKGREEVRRWISNKFTWAGEDAKPSCVFLERLKTILIKVNPVVLQMCFSLVSALPQKAEIDYHCNTFQILRFVLPLQNKNSLETRRSRRLRMDFHF